MSSNNLSSIIYDQNSLKVLDQLLLPLQHEYIEVGDCQQAWTVIKNMNVRGAPAIAIVGCLGLALEVRRKKLPELNDAMAFREHILERLDFLETARPTAVNLKRATTDIRGLLSSADSAKKIAASVIQYAEELFKQDLTINKNLAAHGAKHILDRVGGQVCVLTHCNTGSLATSGHGTALGIVRDLHALGRLDACYCTETRPYNQGSRLTAYELVYEKIPSCFICDSSASALMATKTVAAVIVGADRVARNGDTANKIGTLQLAIAAKHFNVPFYVACPTTSIDLSTIDGSQIPIEERPAGEMVTWQGDKRIPPEGIACWNPAFDITPAALVTGGFVTEHGVFAPPLDHPQTLAALKLCE